MVSSMTKAYNSFFFYIKPFFANNCFKYCKWLKSSIWAIDEILRGTTTSAKCGLESIGKEGLLHTYQNSRTRALPSDAV